jgi:molecular chaperone DnaJ
VDTGSKVRLRGKGGPGRDGGPPGDVVLTISVTEDPRFERRGAHLHTEAPVPLTTAVLGGEVAVPTLGGRVVLRVPASTQNGRAFRLAGKGMPALGQEPPGDLFVKVRVVLPEPLTTQQRAHFEQLRDLEPRPGAADAAEPAAQRSAT